MKSINKIYNHNAISTKLIFVLIVKLFFICSANAQFGNITINTTATNLSKGTWTTVGTVNTFTPSVNGSNVNVADIVSKLGTGDVIISTSCSGCSEAGNITISSAIATSKPAAAPVLKFLAEKTITINAAIDLGIKEGSERTDRNAPSIEFESANGNIISSTNGKISTNPANGFVAGYAKFTANNGSVQINGVITTSSSTSGGPVSIFGNAGVTISANITTSGGTTGILKITDNNNTPSANPDLTNQGQTGGVLTIASFENLGTGAFKLKGANVYTGNTTLTSGNLLLGADNSIPTTSSIIFNGGDFKPSGFNSTIKTIKVTANSTITFDAAQSSTITFDSLLYSSAPSTYITVNGWQGFSQTIALTKNGALSTSSTDFVTTNGTLQNVTNPGGLTQYGQILTSAVGGSGGLKGKIFATSNLTGSILTSTLNKIKFYNGTENKLYQSIQISTKEIIPGAVNP